MGRRALAFLLLVLLVCGAIFAGYAWHREIAPIEPPARSAFDASLVSRGAALAALGDCIACHTAPGGKPYAGGFPLKTQFGTIHGTNITPDPETGIGRWSREAFVRAMREGVDREGRHLYPAFPYDHFTKVADDDLYALYAFFMTREPVRAEPPANDLIFPLDIRTLVAGWKLLFFDRGGMAPNASQSAEWRRGAYLVEGLGHCGACHTPRNVLGAERRRDYLAGGAIEGWHAPALDASSRTPVPWTVDALYEYLRRGASEVHEVAAGPMAPVVHNLGAAPEEDVRAIAVYIASVMGAAGDDRRNRGEQALSLALQNFSPADFEARRGNAKSGADENIQAGGAIYAGTCAICHGAARRAPGAPSSEALHLALSTSASLPQPGNLIRIILQGVAPPDGEPGPFMPGYYGALTDAQVAQVAAYVRAAYTDRPAWPNLEREVRRVRQRLAETGH